MDGISTNRIGEKFISDKRYQKPLDYFEIKIQDPITHTGNMKTFTDYALITKTNIPSFKFKDTCVRRRFSDFKWLKKELEATCHIKFTNFPSEGLSKQIPLVSGRGIFSPSFIEKRRFELEIFMNSIGNHPIVRSQNIFHMFLESLIVDKNCPRGQI